MVMNSENTWQFESIRPCRSCISLFSSLSLFLSLSLSLLHPPSAFRIRDRRGVWSVYPISIPRATHSAVSAGRRPPTRTFFLRLASILRNSIHYVHTAHTTHRFGSEGMFAKNRFDHRKGHRRPTQHPEHDPQLFLSYSPLPPSHIAVNINRRMRSLSTRSDLPEFMP